MYIKEENLERTERAGLNSNVKFIKQIVRCLVMVNYLGQRYVKSSLKAIVYFIFLNILKLNLRYPIICHS